MHALLHEAQINGPYLLVGHSFGGINIRTFAARYSDEVSGIILVDSSHEDQEERIGSLPWPKPDFMSEILSFLDDNLKFLNLGYALMKQSVSTWQRPDRFSAEEWQYHLSLMMKPEHYISTNDEDKFFPQSLAELKEINQSLGDKPVVVITRGIQDELPKDNEQLAEVLTKKSEIWTELQSQLLSLSTNSYQKIADKSGHMIPFEQPEIIVDAIYEMITRLESSLR